MDRADHVRGLKNELAYVTTQYPDDVERAASIRAELDAYADVPVEPVAETPEGPISARRRRK